MELNKLSLNPEALESLFKKVPNLEDVELFSINLEREGAKLITRFDLPEFPDKPSAKWSKLCNTAQIQISFWGISEFEAKGWHHNMKVNIEISKADRFINVKIANLKINQSCLFKCEFFKIDKISAYQVLLNN